MVLHQWKLHCYGNIHKKIFDTIKLRHESVKIKLWHELNFGVFLLEVLHS